LELLLYSELKLNLPNNRKNNGGVNKMKFKLFNADSKRGQIGLNNLVPVVVTFAVAILATGLIAGVVSDDSAASNITNAGLNGMLNLSGQFANIGTIIAIVVIIGLLVGAFAVFRAR
jgi:hypothetical protein